MTNEDHFLDSLRGLKWPARHAVRFGAPGIHPSRVRGPAPEFSEYRAFRQGDDLRRLDWKLLARTDRAYLRLTEDRATIGTLLLLDSTASMDFPERAPTKWSMSARLALGLAQVAHQSGDPVGVATPGGRRTLPPRARHHAVSDIARMLERITPGGHASPVAYLSRRQLPSRVVVFSDFLDGDVALLRLMGTHIARGGEAHGVRLIAPEELDPPDRAFTAVDPESPAVRRPFDPASRDVYRERFAAWGTELAARWRAIGARWTDVRTDEHVVDAIRGIIGGTR